MYRTQQRQVNTSCETRVLTLWTRQAAIVAYFTVAYTRKAAIAA